MKLDLRMTIENIIGLAFLIAYFITGIYYIIIQSLVGILVTIMLVWILLIDVRTMKKNIRTVNIMEKEKT